MSDDYRTHAMRRAQQRCIPPFIVDLLWKYGAERHDKHGCTIRYFDKRAKRQLEKVLGREIVKRFKDKLTCFLVEGDGRAITTGYLTRRLRHN